MGMMEHPSFGPLNRTRVGAATRRISPSLLFSLCFGVLLGVFPPSEARLTGGHPYLDIWMVYPPPPPRPPPPPPALLCW